MADAAEQHRDLDLVRLGLVALELKRPEAAVAVLGGVADGLDHRVIPGMGNSREGRALLKGARVY